MQGTDPQVCGAATETQDRVIGTAKLPNVFSQGVDRAATSGDDCCGLVCVTQTVTNQCAVQAER